MTSYFLAVLGAEALELTKLTFVASCRMAESLQTVSITATAGFVGTVDLSKDSGIWNKTGGINFVVFMVIGFCATLTVIAVVVVTVYFVRYDSLAALFDVHFAFVRHPPARAGRVESSVQS